MKRLALFCILGSLLASQALPAGRRSSVDAVTIGPRHRPGPGPQANSAPFSEDASRTVRGLPMATIPRARDSAKEQLDLALRDWLRPMGLPTSWRPPAEVVDRIVRWDPVETVEHDYGTVYIQAIRLDLSDSSRHQLIESFERQEAGRRLLRLGGLLGFILVSLAAVTGYIRADEATRGYYTNHLRLAALASVGASGYVLTRILG